MKELKCPKCGNVFKVDEADYASIVNQVKNAEFDAEIERRLADLNLRHKAEQELATTKTAQDFQTKLNQKELELGAKEAEINRIKNENEAILIRLTGEKDAEITRLKSLLKNIEAQKDSERSLALAEKDRTIAALNSSLEQEESKRQIAIMQERNKSQQMLQEKESKIAQLKSEAELEKTRAQVHEAELIKQHQNELKAKQELVDYYKDLKTRMSTKMVGETLEIHCSTLFNQMLRPVMPNAYLKRQ